MLNTTEEQKLFAAFIVMFVQGIALGFAIGVRYMLNRVRKDGI